MEPWQSWAVLILGGGTAYYYYTSRQKSKARANRSQSVGKRSESRSTGVREKGQAKRKRLDNTNTLGGSDSAGDHLSLSDATPNDNRVGKPKDVKGKGIKQTARSFLKEMDDKLAGENNLRSSREAEDEESNREFAQRMAGVKLGTNLSAPSKKGSFQKSVKQSAANSSALRLSVDGGNEAQGLSAASSTTGADADDDLSPHLSPALAATTSQHQVSGTDVSDMLEATEKGPSVLRITAPTQPIKPQRVQQQKVVQPEETKKQRQNRKKVEEQKAARMEAEAERRVLLEKQRRIAREAEGRPAKNGVGVSYAPVQSPWTDSKGAPKEEPSKTAGHSDKLSNEPLFDTFVPDDVSSQSSGAGARGTRDNGGSSSSNGTRPSQIWDRDLPSEEEQVRIINAMSDESGWSTVPKGKKNKKMPGRVDEDGNGTEGGTTDARVDGAPNGGAQSAKTITIGSSGEGGSSITGTSAEPVGRAYKHPGDSDWAVL